MRAYSRGERKGGREKESSIVVGFRSPTTNGYSSIEPYYEVGRKFDVVHFSGSSLALAYMQYREIGFPVRRSRSRQTI